MINLRKIISELLVTFLYFGKSPVAPGTIGSLASFPVLILLTVLANYYGYVEHKGIFYFNFAITIIIFFIGLVSTHIYQQETNSHDPKEIVIDEVVGQLLVLEFTMFFANYILAEDFTRALKLGISPLFINISLMGCCFISFRFFDILKPWPIRLVDEKCKTALGVMLDDVVAVPFAVLTSFILSFIWLDALIYFVS